LHQANWTLMFHQHPHNLDRLHFGLLTKIFQ
jgi:hypothetical protein